MYGKRLFFVVIVVLGAVVPYLLMDTTWLAKLETLWERPTTLAESPATHRASETGALISDKPDATSKMTSLVSGRDARERDVQPIDDKQPDPTGIPQSAEVEDQRGLINGGRQVDLPRLSGPPGVQLEQLLSFHVTPEWISQNWSRVTTRLADLDLHGWRVPIALDNHGGLYGSVTYYFDQQRRLQRVLLHGYTRDASDVIRLATTRYQMKRVPSTVSDLYLAKVDGQTVGGLRLDLTPVLRSSSPKRCEIHLELNRQASGYGMSDVFTQFLNQVQKENSILAPISS